jgi:hypothetical protein
MQARRRTIVVLQDEMRRVLDASRVLLEEYAAIAKGDKTQVASSLERVKKSEQDVVTLRSALIRELSQVGTLLVNREDVLRAAFAVEDIFGHVNGVAFKMSQLTKSTAKDKRTSEMVNSLLGLLLDGISKLNDSMRALSINSEQAINFTSEVQQIESAIDSKYREAVAYVVKVTEEVKELLMLKDVLEAIEGCADAMLSASNASTILALGL